jgi:NAD(P)-dependent dehydrogenase (short-subunit alcohol dehydrogenase family)
MTDLRGRTAFITGGANGIGLGIARALAPLGVKLGLADLDLAALARARAELAPATSVEIVELDVRNRDAFAQAVDSIERRLGGISILINNAGVAGSGGLSDLTFDEWDWSLGINLGGVINGIQTVLPRMLARRSGGHVLNTASASGLVGGTATIPYCTAKFGVVGLTESLRPELKAAGIGVSLLCPGPVATGILANSGQTRLHTGRQAEGLPGAEMSTALAKGVLPDEVGRMVLDAILSNRFYVLTDRVILEAMEDRRREILEAMPTGPMNAFSEEVSRGLQDRRRA